jgi:hypothetical protein
MEQTIRRHRLRFSLRTLLVLMTVLGTALGWLGWQVQIVRERKAVLREIERIGGPLGFEYFGLGDEEFSLIDGSAELSREHYAYAGLNVVRLLLGDKSCITLIVFQPLDFPLAERMEKAFPEAELTIVVPESRTTEYRDSLYKKASRRKTNIGTVFKTGLRVAVP